MDIPYFMKINNIYGATSKREAELMLVNAEEQKYMYDNIDHKYVLKNNEPFELLIIKGTSDTNKKIKSLKSMPFNLGDYIEWNRQVWLVTSLDSDDKAHHSGTMTICMYILRWQRPDGKIIERWATTTDASKYESGISSNGALSVGINTNGLILPLDSETKFLKRDRRFVMDKITGDEYEKTKISPDTYKLTNEKPILNDYSYFDRGATTTILLGFTEFNPATDKWVQLPGGDYGWICNYFDPQHPTKEIKNNCTAFIIGGNTIRNRKRSWNVEFRNPDGSVINDFDEFKWKVDCGDGVECDFIDVILCEDDIYCIGLKCVNDKDDIGKEFRLSIVTGEYEEILTSIWIEVVGM